MLFMISPNNFQRNICTDSQHIHRKLQYPFHQILRRGDEEEAIKNFAIFSRMRTHRGRSWRHRSKSQSDDLLLKKLISQKLIHFWMKSCVCLIQCSTSLPTLLRYLPTYLLRYSPTNLPASLTHGLPPPPRPNRSDANSV